MKKTHSIYGVWYYLWFQASIQGLGKHPQYCNGVQSHIISLKEGTKSNANMEAPAYYVFFFILLSFFIKYKLKNI